FRVLARGARPAARRSNPRARARSAEGAVRGRRADGLSARGILVLHGLAARSRAADADVGGRRGSVGRVEPPTNSRAGARLMADQGSPLISVGVPVRNGAATLARALDSLIG